MRRRRRFQGIYAAVKVNWKLVLAVLAIAALIVLGICIGRSIYIEKQNAPSENRPQADVILEVPVVTQYISAQLDNRPGILRKIKYIVIHETANQSKGADAAAHAAFLGSGGEAETSWHYTVDDHEIYQHIPDNEVSWNAGDKLREDGGNLNGISIEMCVNSDGDFEKTFDNTARLTAYLCKAYKLKLDAVKQHYDFNGKNCPLQIRTAGRWEAFLELTQAYLDTL